MDTKSLPLLPMRPHGHQIPAITPLTKLYSATWFAFPPVKLHPLALVPMQARMEVAGQIGDKGITRITSVPMQAQMQVAGQIRDKGITRITSVPMQARIDVAGQIGRSMLCSAWQQRAEVMRRRQK